MLCKRRATGIGERGKVSCQGRSSSGTSRHSGAVSRKPHGSSDHSSPLVSSREQIFSFHPLAAPLGDSRPGTSGRQKQHHSTHHSRSDATRRKQHSTAFHVARNAGGMSQISASTLRDRIERILAELLPGHSSVLLDNPTERYQTAAIWRNS